MTNARVPSTYAIQLQLLGGVLILQLLPALFLGLYTRWFKSGALIIGLVVGILAGIYMALLANNFNSQADRLICPFRQMARRSS